MKLKKIKGLCIVISALSLVSSAFSMEDLTYTVVNKSQRDIIFALNPKCMSESKYYNYILKPMETIQETLYTDATANCAFHRSEVDISIDSISGISDHNYHFSKPYGWGENYWDVMEIRNDTPSDIISAQAHGRYKNQNVLFTINK